MKLPLLISVPHAGLRVPAEVAPLCALSPEQVAEDGDVGADEIYDFESEVECYLKADVARAIVDLNRAEDDRRADGVIKTHTCWNVPVYSTFPSDDTIETLLSNYYRPYHSGLRGLAQSNVKLGVDCHTMAAFGPPVGPDPGMERPWVCLSNADGTCPQEWISRMKDCFVSAFGDHVRINEPFKGGVITRSHAAELPWIQVELSRAPFRSNIEKRELVLTALRQWCQAS